VAPGCLFADLALCSGQPLTLADAKGLSKRTLTPATVSHPATVWWTLQGTAGATPDPAAGGFLDQMGTGANFAPATGSAATYSASVITPSNPYAPTKAQTGKTGKTVFLLATQRTGPLNTVPTLTANGSPIALTAGPIMTNALWSFSLASAVNP